MTKDIIIEINSKIVAETEDEIKVSETGVYYEKSDSIYILYEEKTEDNQIIKNRIKISERSVELKKSGAYTAIMTFSEGEDTKTQYITPFGNMEFDVKTYYVKMNQNDDFIVLELKYDLLSPETVMSKHEMIIKIKPAIS